MDPSQTQHSTSSLLSLLASYSTALPLSLHQPLLQPPAPLLKHTLQALLLVRQMGLVLPPPALQTVLRGAYRAYAANAKFVSPATLPALAFMAAGVVELSSLDLAVTYQVRG